MELKQRLVIAIYAHGTLLIVPYGIETLLMKHFRFSDFLLIVPYGIET